MYTLIGTAKLNEVDPQAWLADVLARIAARPISRLPELLPWAWSARALTRESRVHDNVKQAILDATELDTRLILRPLRNTERVMNNAVVQRVMETERRLGDAITFEDVRAEVAGVYPRIMIEGDVGAGAWPCGMVVGLIHDIPTVAELIDRTMAQAEAIIGARFARTLAG